MFVFYFGFFANVTPPVALAAFAGAGISGGDPMRTGFQALKLSIAGFLIPFIFIYEPALLMVDVEGLATNAREYPLSGFFDIAIVVMTTVIELVVFFSDLEGFLKIHLNAMSRIILVVAAILSVVPEPFTYITGIIIIFIVLGLNNFKWKNKEMPAT